MGQNTVHTHESARSDRLRADIQRRKKIHIRVVPVSTYVNTKEKIIYVHVPIQYIGQIPVRLAHTTMFILLLDFVLLLSYSRHIAKSNNKINAARLKVLTSVDEDANILRRNILSIGKHSE
jgi:hypothetical protein